MGQTEPFPPKAKEGRPQELRRSIIASLTGTSLEWYEFYLFNTAAALVFPRLFFPEFDPVVGILLSFATLAVAFVTRPLGAVIFGHFGDRVGRKTVLVVTVAMMGGATFLMGLLPTYAAIGVWAPLGLIALRLVQGIAVGGEWAGGALLIAERSPKERRGFFTSFVQVGVPIGNLASTGILTFLSATLDEEAFYSWGWRIPFMLSLILLIVALVIRMKVTETEVFLKTKVQGNRTTKSPALEAIRRAPKQIIQVVGIRLGADICYYAFVVFVITYVTTILDLPKSIALHAVLVAGVVELVVYLFWGRLSDRFGRKKISLVGLAGCAVWVPIFFLLLDTKSPSLIIVAVVVGLFFEAAMFGVQASWICELFETNIRYSGASIGYQTASVVGGSLTPFIALFLFTTFNTHWAVVIYILLGLAITLVATLSAPETSGRDLEEPSVNI